MWIQNSVLTYSFSLSQWHVALPDFSQVGSAFFFANIIWHIKPVDKLRKVHSRRKYNTLEYGCENKKMPGWPILLGGSPSYVNVHSMNESSWFITILVQQLICRFPTEGFWDTTWSRRRPVLSRGAPKACGAALVLLVPHHFAFSGRGDATCLGDLWRIF